MIERVILPKPVSLLLCLLSIGAHRGPFIANMSSMLIRPFIFLLVCPCAHLSVCSCVCLFIMCLSSICPLVMHVLFVICRCSLSVFVVSLSHLLVCHLIIHSLAYRLIVFKSTYHSLPHPLVSSSLSSPNSLLANYYRSGIILFDNPGCPVFLTTPLLHQLHQGCYSGE